VNVKRVYRVMKANALLLERHTGSGGERRQDGRVAVDRSGFSIFGTLGADGRRYVYKNAVNRVDLGLRLGDVQAMGSRRSR